MDASIKNDVVLLSTKKDFFPGPGAYDASRYWHSQHDFPCLARVRTDASAHC